jgi:hypothetical protein
LYGRTRKALIVLSAHTVMCAWHHEHHQGFTRCPSRAALSEFAANPKSKTLNKYPSHGKLKNR